MFNKCFRFRCRTTSNQPIIKLGNNGNASNAAINNPRMWSCTKCSYAYNHSWLKKCDICDIPRENSQNVAQQLAPQPPTNLIQVTKIGDTVAPSIESKKELKSVAKISQSKSSHVFDEVPSVVQVPMASFEQDLDDDFTYHPSKLFVSLNSHGMSYKMSHS